ncbi:hypothetical protein OKA05_08185 [Luteolibacter arcticus]|uniref:DUF11 domain-containing protein n=1 Tax=Luteolibacter arcticus TaxID=1581411 RepID=A0ABT3GFZ9_9BACT|nr:autotransporter-associated beta strand repeat-containing protein [Luteolibacter arcticus]MCW1922530.1 hypothetical protein [Luteolibacter arcticus]
MTPSTPSPGRLALGIAVTAVSLASLSAATPTWSNSSTDGLWSTPANWNTGNRPLSSDTAIFPAGLGGTVTLDAVMVTDVLTSPTAQSIQFHDDYTVTGSSFIRPGGNVGIGVSSSSTVNFNAPLTSASLALDVDGMLEITGPLGGSMNLDKSGTGTVILSGTNTTTGDREVYEGTLQITSDAAWGSSHSIRVDPSATLDASAMTVPIQIPSGDFANIYGTFRGDLTTSGYLQGNGQIDGTVHAEAGSYVLPDNDGQLHVTGDFTFDASAEIEFYIAHTTPLVGYNQMRVGGIVSLDGDLLLDSDPVLPEGESFFLLLNDGNDPIDGTFDGLPEGGVIPIGNGLALQITYQANGDGGAAGNDVGVTVVPDLVSTDLALTVDAPLAVDLGAAFAVTYTINNLGPNDSTASSLEVELPAAATFNGSTPAGSVIHNLLTIPVTALTHGSSTTVTLNFTAPVTTGSVFVAPWIYNGTGDAIDSNNYAPSMTAVLPGSVPVLDSFHVDPENDLFSLTLETVPDVRYGFQRSIDLVAWADLDEFLGNGNLMEFHPPMEDASVFFRFRILPYAEDGVGEPE